MHIEDQRVIVNSDPNQLTATNFSTDPYPGFPTDMQAQMMVLNCVANGHSTMTETIFPDRFHHVNELVKMGAELHRQDNQVSCQGGVQFVGADTHASDLRASASLILAALVAEGDSVIHDIQHIDRGYELIEEKLVKLGATIYRVHSNYERQPVNETQA